LPHRSEPFWTRLQKAFRPDGSIYQVLGLRLTYLDVSSAWRDARRAAILFRLSAWSVSRPRPTLSWKVWAGCYTNRTSREDTRLPFFIFFLPARKCVSHHPSLSGSHHPSRVYSYGSSKLSTSTVTYSLSETVSSRLGHGGKFSRLVGRFYDTLAAVCTTETWGVDDDGGTDAPTYLRVTQRREQSAPTLCVDVILLFTELLYTAVKRSLTVRTYIRGDYKLGDAEKATAEKYYAEVERCLAKWRAYVLTVSQTGASPGRKPHMLRHFMATWRTRSSVSYDAAAARRYCYCYCYCFCYCYHPCP